MAPDPDLLLAVLALQKGFVSEEDFRSMVEHRARDGSKSVKKLLLEGGDLAADDLEALEVLAAEMTSHSATEATVLFRDSAAPRDEEPLLDFDALESEFDARGAEEDVSGEDAKRRGLPLPDSRYEFKEELGRGALGRVVLAVDRKLDREVAVKFAIEAKNSPDALARFLREGQVAGRLAHPNVVPVYDLGTMDTGEGPSPFFTMARITGLDLARVLDDVELDRDGARKVFTQARLLQIFLDVCNAMAWAHDHGVVHRDLKPANVMIGKYGETFVIDWGLAKVLGKPDPPDGAPRPADSPDHSAHAAGATMDGMILGTPAYMSPEQAEGRVEEIDTRSDIYSLGAILYQILTFRPPFEGASALEVLAKVVEGTIQRPTLRASQIRTGTPLPRHDGDLSFERPVPPELEEICLRALARNKEDRFDSAFELGSEIQSFLDGEKTRERLRQLAGEKVVEGRDLVRTLDKLRAEHARVSDAISEETKRVESFWPVERKRGLWDLQRRQRTLSEGIVRTFGRIVTAFQEALGFNRDNGDARAALADLYWDQFEREEKAGDQGQMLYFAGLLRQYNDGQYDTKLKGDGRLDVRTRAFGCRCLSAGRTVEPAELKILGFHLFSGRPLSHDTGGEAELEPTGPLALKVHGPDCRTEPVEGAHAWLFRFEEKDKALVPGYPAEAASSLSRREGDGEPKEELEAALDLLFPRGSPFRPSWGLYLGRTPVEDVTVPMGSYLVVLHKDGFHPVRAPFIVRRLDGVDLDVTLFGATEVPEDFVPVPGGPFDYHGDVDNPYSGFRETRDLPDFFMNRFQVTCAAYLEFLNDPEERRSGRSESRVPREAGEAGPYWPRDGNGMFHLPTASWLETAPQGLREAARRLAQSPLDWEPDWPVMAVSWRDAVAYASWYSRRTGFLTCLPHEELWEKAGRGTDGRLHSWGHEFEDVYQNCIRSFDGPNRPAPVNSFPMDESPYGVRGMGGNATEWCLNDLDDGRRLLRGGSWLTFGLSLRITARMAGAPVRIGHANGFRLALLCRIPVDAPAGEGQEGGPRRERDRR